MGFTDVKASRLVSALGAGKAVELSVTVNLQLLLASRSSTTVPFLNVEYPPPCFLVFLLPFLYALAPSASRVTDPIRRVATATFSFQDQLLVTTLSPL